MVVDLPDPRTPFGASDTLASVAFAADGAVVAPQDAADEARRGADLALLSRLAAALQLPPARFADLARETAGAGEPHEALDPAAQAALSRIADRRARDLLRRRLSELP